MKKIVSLIMLCFFTLCVFAQTTVKYEVQAGDTFTSIARNHNISIAELSNLNPTVEPDRLRAGQTINVPGHSSTAQAQTSTPSPRPKYKEKHKVAKKETIYSITHLYDITEEQLYEANPELRKGKLKKGSIINIPYSETENKAYQETIRQTKEAEIRRRKEEEASKALNATVILPFALGSNMTAEAQKMANIYQGFLLAVDTLKQQGYSVNVYAYDENATDIYTTLNKPMMKNMQLIVGPMRQQNIVAVADFASQNNITHVVPLSNSTSVINNHPTTFQVNVPNTKLYSMASSKFCSMHRTDNIIFVTMNDENNSLMTEMKRKLDEANEFYYTIKIADINKIKDIVSTTKLNVIVPSAASAAAFSTLCNKLNAIRFPEGTRIQMFGQPEWQTFTAKHQANLAKYRCQFFTSFYHNPYASNTIKFENRFNHWFHQSQYNSYPRYGEFGFDIGMYFLKGLKKHRNNFNEHVTSMKHSSLEFPMNFERKNEWSGWQNHSMIIVTYDTEGRITMNIVE